MYFCLFSKNVERAESKALASIMSRANFHSTMKIRPTNPALLITARTWRTPNPGAPPTQVWCFGTSTMLSKRTCFFNPLLIGFTRNLNSFPHKQPISTYTKYNPKQHTAMASWVKIFQVFHVISEHKLWDKPFT